MTVQRIMDLKQSKHWRSQPNYEHRFTYHGFLICARCGELIHTNLSRRDYYVCKGRRSDKKCETRYMARDRIEPIIDQLFSAQLTSACFLERCIAEFESRCHGKLPATESARDELEVKSLRARRRRTIDSYIDGTITREDRDRRLTLIDEQIRVHEKNLPEEQDSFAPDVETLVSTFSVLAEWDFWSREQKRKLLATLVPEIRVADYQVESLGLNPAIFSNENTRMGTDSLRPRA